MNRWWRGRQVLVRIDGRNVPSALAHIRATLARHEPDRPLNYTFLSQEYDALYSEDERFRAVANVFTVLSIIIASFGLFGLATFAAQQRTKEMGIRKVLGATAADLVALLASSFVRMIAVAIVIALPIAFFAAKWWLDDFAYRIHLGPSVFIAAAAAILLVALVTISYQSLKAALRNPVESLRYE